MRRVASLSKPINTNIVAHEEDDLACCIARRCLWVGSWACNGQSRAVFADP